MKLISRLFCLLCVTQIFANIPCTYALFSSTPVFYQIISNEALFYRTSRLNDSDTYFILPSTYFVKFNYSVDEETLAVSYLDFDGFVKSSDVKRVYSTPAHPYLEHITFCPNEVANLVLRAQPSTQSAFLGTIPYSATEVAYFGAINGESVYSTLPSTWYFCRYTSPEQGVITGYVYAPLTRNLSPIEPNSDLVELEPVSPTSAEITLSPELQSTSNIVLILILTLPVLLIVFLALKSNKNKRSKNLKREFKRNSQLTLRAPPNDEDFDF